ncbi:MAG: PH domain-containing protein [Clostridia bacterium]|nr:PH domain-containing protein [Clostridia bacterium]
MKTYKYKFTKLITAFIWIGVALSVVAFGLNTYFVFADGIATAANAFYPILRYVLMYFVSIAAFVILISLVFSSYYSISGTKFKTSFGIIKSSYDIEKIESVVLDRKTKKLSVYFEDKNFVVIVVKEEWYEDFIEELLKANGKIEYTINSKENDIDEEKK